MKSLILIMFITPFVILSCSKNSTESEPQIIPLDGRGGGVIAYCYQPLQSGIHQIYAVNADGSGNKKMIDASIGLNHHDWSPDAQKIAAVGYVGSNFSTWSIHIFNADGTNLTRLTSQTGVWDNEPRWSPAGNRIAFTRIYPADNNKEEIWMMNSDGSNQHYIGVEGNLGGWDPNGSKLIFTTEINDNYEIFTCADDGTNIQQITNTTENEIAPQYSPDGNQVVYSIFTGDLFTNTNTSTYEICVMNADGTNIRQLTNNNFFDGSARWSPDSALITFGSDRHAEKQWEVYIMNVDGTNVRRVTNSPSSITAINPAWRPISSGI